MAYSAHGTQLMIRDGESRITVSEVLDISGPVSRREPTLLFSDDPSEPPAVVVSQTEADSISFEINYTAAETQAQLRTALFNASVLSFELAWPTNPVEVAAFDGMVTGFEPEAPVEGKLAAAVTITIASHIEYRSNEE